MPFALLKLAYAEGIKIEYWDFALPVRGFYVYEPGMPPVIGLANDLFNNYREFRCVLAEELGHHFTTAGRFLPCIHHHYSDRVNIGRAEYRAMKWAANYLIPEDKLRAAFRRGITQVWELTEHFNVNEEMMRFRLNLPLTNTRYA